MPDVPAFDPVTRKIKAWCDELMDLSRKNPLIALPKSAIPLPDLPDALWEMPDRGAKRLRFVSDKLPGTDISRDIKANERALPADRYRTLQTLFQSGRRSVEEQGVPILFVACGLLEWREPGRADPVRSPILLLPVELERLPLDAGYNLSRRDDDPELNPSLLYRLAQSDLQVALPEFDAAAMSSGAYLAALSDALPARFAATVIADTCYLGRFSYLNLFMYKEIAGRIEEARNHPLIAAIAGDANAMQALPQPDVPPPDSESPNKTFHVLSADPSQEAAVAAARYGRNLVIQGPPGTGKTQTIANLIATAIADGKRVLFVSEKTAALDAVYKRLHEHRLGDFCLRAHSHTASKTEILAQLRKAKAATGGKPKDVDTDVLALVRGDLNASVQALHQKREPLGISLYDARAGFAELADIPEPFFALPPVEDIDAPLRFHWETLAERLATFHALFAVADSHPWRALKAESFSSGLQETVEALLTTWHDAAKTLCSGAEELARELGTSGETPTATDADWLMAVATQTAQSPRPPARWLVAPPAETAVLKRNATATRDRYNKFEGDRAALASRFKDAVYDADHAATVAALTQTPRPAMITAFGNGWADVADTVLGDVSARIGEVESAIARFAPGMARLANLVGVAAPETLAETASLLQSLDAAQTDFAPLPQWFAASIAALEQTATETRTAFAKRDAARETVAERFAPSIYDQDIHGLRDRYAAQYASIFRVFSGDFWRDQKTLTGCLQPGATLKGADVAALLADACTAKDANDALTAQNAGLRETFGGYYGGETTDWQPLTDALRQTATLKAAFGGNVPAPLRDRMCAGGAAWEELRDQTALVRDGHERLKSTLATLQAVAELPTDAARPGNRFPLPELATRLAELRQVIAAFGNARQAARQVARGDIPTAELAAGFAETQRLIAEETAIRQGFAENETRFAPFFAGLQTPWETVLASLANAETFAELWAQKSLSPSAQAVEWASNADRSRDAERLAALAASLRPARHTLGTVWAEVSTHFDAALIRFGDSEPLQAQRDWTRAALAELPVMERFLSFMQTRRDCDRAGLLSFSEKMVQSSPPPAQIPLILRKAFLRRWNDTISATVPEVHALSTDAHAPRRERFAALDRAQIAQTPARIRETMMLRRRLIFDAPLNIGEVGTLTRYLAQTRPRASVRKILGDIPNLLFRLTPCVMMSPLSVSLFLDPDRIAFDMVIFDEASQVFPQYALGALMRSDQAVIAGDNKQLPPTPFFRKMSEQDEDDEESEASDPNEFESILDAASVAFGETGNTTLDWHYRSRHESLIDFSNRAMYAPANQPLNTFPSVQKASTVGFVHVDGVYRGGAGNKRDNPVEAAKVAELVAAQVRERPGESVGVITMSGAQETCVRAAVEELKMFDPALAGALNEDATNRREPFFVKSIEDVQGDERDCVFLSVGYGKWADGKARMAFGPLGKDGGERRLNVAITRAKSRLTAISSLHPGEIVPSPTAKRGVYLLRDYLAYAQTASGTAQAGAAQSQDSFVEAVAVGLQKRGHRTRRDVGTSEYRVDLAIESPDDAEQFALGIECDGANYENGETARAREWLRGSVLQELGWRLCRVWSADWLRDPGAVLDAIEAALREPVAAPEPDETHDTLAGEPEAVEDTPTPEPVKPGGTLPGLTPFVAYTEPLPGGTDTLYGNTRADEETRWAFVLAAVAQEEPVHADVIAQRLREGASLASTGAKIKRIATETLLLLSQAGQVEKHDDFYRLAGSRTMPARVPRMGDKPRPVEQISVEEIAEIALVVIRHAVGVRPAEAIDAVSRLMGYERVGTAIAERVGQGVSLLEYENRVHSQNGQLRTLEE